MINFMYDNWKQLDQIGRECFGTNAEASRVSKQYLSLFLYEIAYSIVVGRKLNKEVYEKVKKEVKQQDSSNEIRIFFEKVEHCENDILYFQDALQKMEKNSSFAIAYQSYLEEFKTA